MRIKHISISNFKGLRSAILEPTEFSCLVGENNSGKSSVLQAIVIALNRPAQVSRSLHYDETLPIEFQIKIADVVAADLARLVDEHRQKLDSQLADGAMTLVVRYSPGEKCDVKILKRVPIEVRFRDSELDENFKGRKGAAVRETIQQMYPEVLSACPEGTNATSAKLAVKAHMQSLLPDQFELAEGALPSGISSSISALLPEAIYIPAVKNFADDLKTTQSTSLGRLLGLLLEDMAPDLSAISASLSNLDAMLNRVIAGGVEVDNRHDKVKRIENLVERFLAQNFPKARVEVRIPPPELRAILNSAQVYVDDGCKDLIDNKGDGIKRSLTFALLQTYVHHLAERTASGAQEGVSRRPLIFLFEEPELYLHPRSQLALFNTLSSISKTHCVVVTTHSPLFFAPGVTAGFVRIAKREATPKPIGELFPVNFELDNANAEVFRMARFENAAAGFFSRRVVLFEGESDDHFFRHASRMLDESWDADKLNVAYVRVSGKGNFSRYRRFFDAFGIEVKVVADLDALFDGFNHLGADAEASTLRTEVIQYIDSRITSLGIRAEPKSRQIRDKVTSESWGARYAEARQSVRDSQATGTVSADALQKLDRLFTWDADTARIKVCMEDPESRVALVPLLDKLRSQGICVLSRGAIEDYYPADTPKIGQKPERALAATALVTDAQNASALSTALTPGRQTELREIFQELFRSLA